MYLSGVCSRSCVYSIPLGKRLQSAPIILRPLVIRVDMGSRVNGSSSGFQYLFGPTTSAPFCVDGSGLFVASSYALQSSSFQRSIICSRQCSFVRLQRNDPEWYSPSIAKCVEVVYRSFIGAPTGVFNLWKSETSQLLPT